MWPKDSLEEVLLTLIQEWFVDVQDTARLHVAALVNPNIQNERILALAEPFNAM